MNRLALRVAAALLLASALTHPALAGTVYTESERTLQTGKESITATISMDNRRLRVEIVEAGKPESDMTIIFKDKQMLLLNAPAREYMLVDDAFTQKLKSAAAQITRKVEEQLATLPEAERAAMRKSAEEQIPWMREAPKKAPIQFRKTGKQQKAGGYTCTLWEGMAEGKLRYEYCVAPFSEVAGSQELVDAMKAVKALLLDLPQLGDDPLGDEWEGIGVLDGYPVLTREYKDGKPDNESLLSSVRNAALDDALFSPPADYKRMELPLPDLN